MKRCLLAAAILIAVNVGLASAEFVVVRIDLNQLINANHQPTPGAQQGQAGQAMPGGGGQGGQLPNKGGKGAGKGGKGGQFPPPKPAPGQPQGKSDKASQPGLQIPPIYVYAYVEVTNPKVFSMSVPNAAGKNLSYTNFQLFEIDYKLDNHPTKLWAPGQDGPFEVFGWPIEPAAKRADKLRKDALKETTAKDKRDSLLSAAKWALQRGQLSEFQKCIDDLKKLDPKDAVVMALETTQNELNKQPAKDDPAAKSVVEDLKGYRTQYSKQGHYLLLTNSKKTTEQDAEVGEKLAKLEAVYTAFFYWHALGGQPRTPPPFRLVVVLVDSPTNGAKDFESKHQEFNFPPLIGTGFLAQRDNVMVLAPRRTDDTFELLDGYNQTLWTKSATNLHDLLTNKPFLKDKAMIAKANPALAKDIAEAQALALCQKAMADETEMLALSHHTVRQLIAATAILPRNILTAEWARCGLASMFEVPPTSFYPSTGGANWSLLIEFKQFRKANKLEAKDAKEILYRVVTDRFFRQAHGTFLQSLHNADERAALKEQSQEELEVARATSWALMHYLAHRKGKQLERYFEEIRNLPRDLDYDSTVLWGCFCRAFGLRMPDPENPTREMDDVAKLESLAKAWFTDVDHQALDSEQYEAVAMQWRDPANLQPRPLMVQPGTGGNAGPGSSPGKN